MSERALAATLDGICIIVGSILIGVHFDSVALGFATLILVQAIRPHY